jgi:predicted secreted hydrolase
VARPAHRARRLRRREAGSGDTALRCATGRSRARRRQLHARLPAADFGLDLRFTPTQPVLLQGRRGLSRKGPSPEQASYYYSEPQLAVPGTLTLQGRASQ